MKTPKFLSRITKILQTRIATLENICIFFHSNICLTKKNSSKMKMQTTKPTPTINTMEESEFVYAWKAPKWLVD